MPSTAAAYLAQHLAHARLAVLQAFTRVMHLMLRELDVRVINDSTEALAALRTGAFDSILCDLMMPNVTGIDIHRELRSTEVFIRSVPNPCLRKPFSTNDLRKACAQMARRKSAF